MEGAQNAQAVLAGQPTVFSLRLYSAEPGRGKSLQYLSLLWLPVCYYSIWGLVGSTDLAAACCCLSWLGLFLGIKIRWPYPRLVPAGELASTTHELQLTVYEQQQVFSLDDTLRVTINCQGFRGEQLAPRIWANGVDNYIQLNDGELYRFEMLTAESQELLRAELRRWYGLKLRLKEFRQDGPTFLLQRNLSYEQIQAYKQEFGVNLYG